MKQRQKASKATGDPLPHLWSLELDGGFHASNVGNVNVNRSLKKDRHKVSTSVAIWKVYGTLLFWRKFHILPIPNAGHDSETGILAQAQEWNKRMRQRTSPEQHLSIRHLRMEHVQNTKDQESLHRLCLHIVLSGFFVSCYITFPLELTPVPPKKSACPTTHRSTMAVIPLKAIHRWVLSCF